MSATQDTTAVIFRKFPEGDVIALLPEMAGTNEPWTCNSYQHIGQHGAANLSLVQFTGPATPIEYADLLAELTRIGYKVRVMKRRTRAMDEARRKESGR